MVFSPWILVVDEEDATRNLCGDVIREVGMCPRMAATTEQALEILDGNPIDIVIADSLVPELGGIELVKRIRKNHPLAMVLILAHCGEEANAAEAIKMGATDYLKKPFRVDDLRNKVDNLLHARNLWKEDRALREYACIPNSFDDLVGISPKMQQVRSLIEKVSQHNYPVLILGETGTGKELVARSIHQLGARRNKPFSPVDCTSIVSTLIESELFGYVKGAFTGALDRKHGVLESAKDGTVFLDEIGDMPVELQAKLLRALQEKEVKPVGSTGRIPISIRVLAATNRDLDNAVRAGTFRQDLFYRLNVVQIKLPPLREHKMDIPVLVIRFLQKYRDKGEPEHAFSEVAMDRLMAYDWPGNVRELENCIQRAMALGASSLLGCEDLPVHIQYHLSTDRLVQSEDLVKLDELERRAIFRAMLETSGDKLAASRLLGIGKTTLYRKLKQYGEHSAK